MSEQYAYNAVTSGTIAVPSGQYVKQITCHTTTGGTLTIGSGATITLPSGVSYTENFENLTGVLVGPLNIVFSGTDTAVVSWWP